MLDTDLTSFVMANLTVAAHRLLADRAEFVLDADSRAAWEAINNREPHDVAGLRALRTGRRSSLTGDHHRYRRTRVLQSCDALDQFECRSPEQTTWLHEHARQPHAAGTAQSSTDHFGDTWPCESDRPRSVQGSRRQRVSAAWQILAPGTEQQWLGDDVLTPTGRSLEPNRLPIAIIERVRRGIRLRHPPVVCVLDEEVHAGAGQASPILMTTHEQVDTTTDRVPVVPGAIREGAKALESLDDAVVNRWGRGNEANLRPEQHPH